MQIASDWRLWFAPGARTNSTQKPGAFVFAAHECALRWSCAATQEYCSYATRPLMGCSLISSQKCHPRASLAAIQWRSVLRAISLSGKSRVATTRFCCASQFSLAEADEQPQLRPDSLEELAENRRRPSAMRAGRRIRASLPRSEPTGCLLRRSSFLPCAQTAQADWRQSECLLAERLKICKRGSGSE